MILFHGTADTTVPFAQAERFVQALREAGDEVEFFPAEDVPHGFFNFGRYGNRWFDRTTREMLRFLKRQGFFESRARGETETEFFHKNP